MIRYAIFFFVMTCLMTASAQDKVATDLLEKLHDYYSDAKSIQLVMDMDIQYPEEKNVTSRVMINQSGSKFSMIHPDQEIYCDGNDVWLYIKKHNEVQINDYDEESSNDMVITPLDLLKQYKSGDYEYRVINSEDGQVEIEFKPLDRDSDYSKFKATIVESDKSIPSMWAYGKDGSKVKISTISMTRNTTSELPEATFLFDKRKYPGVKIEDLRLD